MLEDFVKENDMPAEVIEKYRDRVSEDAVEKPLKMWTS